MTAQSWTLPARAALLATLIPVAALAQAPTPSRPPAPPVKAKPAAPVPAAPDPVYEASKAAFEALPEVVRKGVQDALVWTGDYNAVTAGTFGRRTYEGIATWQKRSGAEPTGILTAPQRAALDAAGEAARNTARFKVQVDTGSGAVIGVPEKLLPKRSVHQGGTRWQSADGRITLETKSFKPGETDLDALFERATGLGPDRRITYKLKKPDFIVVTGETGSGRSYIRYASGIAGIRGFTVGYDRALATEADRLVIAVANSFLPFPESAPAAPAGGIAATPTAPTLAPTLPSRPAATGIAIAPGRILTSAAALEGCAAPSIGGAPARLAKKDASGALALLETEPRPSPTQAATAPSPRTDALKTDEPLLVLGAEAKGAASVAPGVAGTGSVFAPLQPGAGGAPVLDRAGRLVGLIARFPTAPRLIAGVMPPTSYMLVPGAAVTGFLSENGIAPGLAKAATGGTLGAAAAPVVASVVAIGCGR